MTTQQQTPTTRSDCVKAIPPGWMLAPQDWREEVLRIAQFADTATRMSIRDMQNNLSTIAEDLAGLLTALQADSDSASPVEDARTKALDTLIAHAEGRICRTNAGSCPDIMEGHDVRDDDCPVCQALIAVQSDRPSQCQIRAVADALRPFAEIGAWLFARTNIPDDEPVVDVNHLNGVKTVLTRGNFKAAHQALQALTSDHQPDGVATGGNELGELIGSFDAAFSEGLQEALAETTDDRLKDLVERRLLAGYWIATGPSLKPAAGAELPGQPTQASDPIREQAPLPEPVAYRYQPKDGLNYPAYTERFAQALSQDPAAVRLYDEGQIMRILKVEREILAELHARIAEHEERERMLHSRISELEAARIAYASEFPPIQKGDDAGLPDVGSIHANIRALKARLKEAQKNSVQQEGGY